MDFHGITGSNVVMDLFESRNTTAESESTATLESNSTTRVLVPPAYEYDGRAPKRVILSDISPANCKRTSGANRNVATPDDISDSLHINPRSLHKRSYLPSYLQNHLVYSSIDWKWRAKSGVDFDVRLHEVVHDELNREKSSGKKKSWAIDLELLANVLWALMLFLFGTRHLKTRAGALVQCIFRVLVKEYPEVFKDVLLKECRSFMRENVTWAYKFQRTIDTQPTGGLNYGSIEGIRKGVEGLCTYEMGSIPSSATIARCVRQLEHHAAFDYGLVIHETTTEPGPVFSFEIYNFIRTILKGFGLSEKARTGSLSRPVMICWTLDYAQLPRELGHLTGGVKIMDPHAVDPNMRSFDSLRQIPIEGLVFSLQVGIC
jgi:hypothetical protein